jgi:hypothetical protein
LKDFWINSHVLDCPTPLLKFSANGQPVQIQSPTGDCTITTPVSNTGSGGMPSSSTINLEISSELKLLKNKKINHSNGLQSLAGNGCGHQLPQNAISETL